MIIWYGKNMKTDKIKKAKCSERHCNWKGLEGDLLEAQNPFDPFDTLIGCPECKSINTIYPVCDEEGCWDAVTCGTPTPEGYRSTCGNHWPNRKA